MDYTKCLTKAERAVDALIKEGLSSRKIASKLNLSIPTIFFYKQLIRKIRKAYEEGAKDKAWELIEV